MSLKLNSLTSVLVLAAAVCGFNSTAIAQSANDTQPNLAEVFEKAYYANDPNFFRNRSFERQFDLISGWGWGKTSYLENEITEDTEALDILYRNTLDQQNDSDPVIRTRDLPNPYETSVLRSLRFNFNNPTLTE